MCFQLYIGSETALPEVGFNHDNPQVYVEALPEEAKAVAAYLDSRCVQYVGSSEGCGCGFRHVMQPGDPYYASDEDTLVAQRDQQKLVEVLAGPIQRKEAVKLFSCWHGDWNKPIVGEFSVRLSQIKDPSFAFAENCLYAVLPD